MSFVWMWQFHRPSPPDHHDGVADARPHLFEGLDRIVGRAEEVHDLVAQVADGVLARRPHHRRPRRVAVEGAEVRCLDPRGLGQGPAVEHEEERIEQEQVAGAAGVHHAGLGQDGQHLGRAGESVGRLAAALSTTPTRPVPLAAPGCGGGGHRQDGALDRAHHGPPGQVGGVRDGVYEDVGLDAGVPGARHALAHAPEELREDHARVPAGAHQRAVPDGLAHRGQAGPGLHPLQLADHRFEGQRHVGAGVPVGHRVDVEPVDVALVQPQGIPVSPHHGAQFVGAQRRRGGHGRGC